MQYSEQKVLQAFELYSVLARDGIAGREEVRLYKSDDGIRGLVDRFALHVDCIVIFTGEQMYLIPKTKLSNFHVTNEYIKRTYLRSNATNSDIYILYFGTIVLFGAFYDSYQTLEPTRSFITLEEWTELVDERIAALKEHDEDVLRASEQEFSYNWLQIIEKWDGTDDVRETAKKQSGNTISRLSFMDAIKRFLIHQQLTDEIGPNELALTEKAKTIVQRYFMEVEYNKGILEFLYQWEDEADAIHQ